MMKYPPPGFTAAIYPPDYSDFGLPGFIFDEFIDCVDFKVGLTLYKGASVSRDPGTGVTIVLTGYNLGGKTLPQLLDMYKRLGGAFAAELDGLYSLLIIDPQTRKVLVATDRAGSHSVYTRTKAGIKIISTSVNALAHSSLELDPASIVWYLTNARFSINRTLFKEIRKLETCSWYEFFPGGEKQNVYWRIWFTDEFAGKSEDELKAELSGLLIDAVRRSIPGNSPILVSLSKGHDITGILGIMVNRLGLTDLKTFSYGVHEDEPLTDASLSKELAAKLGISHTFIPAYRGDVCGVIHKNIQWWGCASEFCDEIDVWEALNDEYSDKKCVLFTGEINFGWTDAVMDNIDEMLNICLVRSFDNYNFLNSLLPPKQLKNYQEILNQETKTLIDRFPSSDNFNKNRDYFFMDQRKITSILPWRDYYAGRTFEARAPFMGKEINEFVIKLPDYWRNGKRLYKHTIEGMFPDIYSIPPAKFGGARADWEKELCENRDAVAEQFIKDGTTTAFDAFISPDILLKLLMMQGNPDTSRLSAMDKMLKIPGKAANKLLGNKPRYIKQLGSHLVLLRSMLIRGYLKNLQENKPVDDLSVDW
jgi:hypothetical protein